MFKTIRRTPYGCIQLVRRKDGEHCLIVNPSGRYRALYGGVTWHTAPGCLSYDADMLASDLIYAATGRHANIASHAMRRRVDPVPTAEYR